MTTHVVDMLLSDMKRIQDDLSETLGKEVNFFNAEGTRVIPTILLVEVINAIEASRSIINSANKFLSKDTKDGFR